MLHSRHIWTFKNLPFCQSIIVVQTALRPAHLPWKQVILTIIHLTLFKHTSALPFDRYVHCTMYLLLCPFPLFWMGVSHPRQDFPIKTLTFLPLSKGGNCETDNRRGCVTFRKRGRRREVGGEQVVVACCAVLSLSSGCPARCSPHFDNKKSMLGMQLILTIPPTRKCE